MKVIAVALTVLWIFVIAAPSFALLTDSHTCCGNCTGSACPITKAPVHKGKNSKESCHEQSQQPLCYFKANGCEHKTDDMVFHFEAVVANEVISFPFEPIESLGSCDHFYSSESLTHDTPPPRSFRS
jgi:hypothetical protein